MKMKDLIYAIIGDRSEEQVADLIFPDDILKILKDNPEKLKGLKSPRIEKLEDETVANRVTEVFLNTLFIVLGNIVVHSGSIDQGVKDKLKEYTVITDPLIQKYIPSLGEFFKRNLQYIKEPIYKDLQTIESELKCRLERDNIPKKDKDIYEENSILTSKLREVLDNINDIFIDNSVQFLTKDPVPTGISMSLYEAVYPFINVLVNKYLPSPKNLQKQINDAYTNNGYFQSGQRSVARGVIRVAAPTAIRTAMKKLKRLGEISKILGIRLNGEETFKEFSKIQQEMNTPHSRESSPETTESDESDFSIINDDVRRRLDFSKLEPIGDAEGKDPNELDKAIKKVIEKLKDGLFQELKDLFNQYPEKKEFLLNYKDISGHTLLYIAIKYANLEAVQFLSSFYYKIPDNIFLNAIRNIPIAENSKKILELKRKREELEDRVQSQKNKYSAALQNGDNSEALKIWNGLPEIERLRKKSVEDYNRSVENLREQRYNNAVKVVEELLKKVDIGVITTGISEIKKLESFDTKKSKNPNEVKDLRKQLSTHLENELDKRFKEIIQEIKSGLCTRLEELLNMYKDGNKKEYVDYILKYTDISGHSLLYLAITYANVDAVKLLTDFYENIPNNLFITSIRNVPVDVNKIFEIKDILYQQISSIISDSTEYENETLIDMIKNRIIDSMKHLKDMDDAWGLAQALVQLIGLSDNNIQPMQILLSINLVLDEAIKQKSNNAFEIVGMLAKKVDIDVVKKGISEIEVLQESIISNQEKQDIVNDLRERMQKYLEELDEIIQEIKNGSSQKLQAIFDHSSKKDMKEYFLNYKDAEGHTLLHIAVMNANIEAVKILTKDRDRIPDDLFFAVLGNIPTSKDYRNASIAVQKAIDSNGSINKRDLELLKKVLLKNQPIDKAGLSIVEKALDKKRHTDIAKVNLRVLKEELRKKVSINKVALQVVQKTFDKTKHIKIDIDKHALEFIEKSLKNVPRSKQALSVVREALNRIDEIDIGIDKVVLEAIKEALSINKDMYRIELYIVQNAIDENEDITDKSTLEAIKEGLLKSQDMCIRKLSDIQKAIEKNEDITDKNTLEARKQVLLKSQNMYKNASSIVQEVLYKMEHIEIEIEKDTLEIIKSALDRNYPAEKDALLVVQEAIDKINYLEKDRLQTIKEALIISTPLDKDVLEIVQEAIENNTDIDQYTLEVIHEILLKNLSMDKYALSAVKQAIKHNSEIKIDNLEVIQELLFKNMLINQNDLSRGKEGIVDSSSKYKEIIQVIQEYIDKKQQVDVEKDDLETIKGLLVKNTPIDNDALQIVDILAKKVDISTIKEGISKMEQLQQITSNNGVKKEEVAIFRQEILKHLNKEVNEVDQRINDVMKMLKSNGAQNEEELLKSIKQLFIEAQEKGSIYTIDYLLNFKDGYGHSLLHVAITNANKRAAEYIAKFHDKIAGDIFLTAIKTIPLKRDGEDPEDLFKRYNDMLSLVQILVKKADIGSIGEGIKQIKILKSSSTDKIDKFDLRKNKISELRNKILESLEAEQTKRCTNIGIEMR